MRTSFRWWLVPSLVLFASCRCGPGDVSVPPPAPLPQSFPDTAPPPPQREAAYEPDLPHGSIGVPADAAHLKDLGKPQDPPPVAKALEHRELEPEVALAMLREVWAGALKKKDARLAAYALNRSGDVLLDLSGRLSGDEDRPWATGPDAGVLGRTDACALAHDDYLRAFGLAELAGDRRLLGRIAHDIAWAYERCRDDDGLVDRAEAIVHWYETALSHRLAAGEAAGVRTTANNLGRYIARPKWRRLELYQLAAEAARIAKDPAGLRKTHGNIARLWFYSADTRWASPDGGATSDGTDGYASVPLKGEVRQRFLFHLQAALDAAKQADEAPVTVCEGLQVGGPDCDEWGNRTAEELFPEGCCADPY